MEEMEFAGNDSKTRELFHEMFINSGRFWFPTEHPVDLYDRIYEDTKELVA
jgi:hypothetical protein